mgnify:CR=1 FL=1
MNVYTKEMAEAISALAVEKGGAGICTYQTGYRDGETWISAEESSIEEIKEIAELPN